jgi:LuxR family maltose regulon positive regulatory protein
MLQSPQPPPLESILTTLVNDIATMSSTLVCVFDDYDVIQAQPIHEALTFLLDHLPPPAHLILTSRTDPPLPLARLRARGQLTEIRAADLRFTTDEVASLLNQILGLTLPAREIAALEERTEGWIVGLQLAALSMQGRDDVSGFIKALTGDDRYIMDYLMSEVLQRQLEHIQTFLLHTSILDRLTGPLCNSVTSRSDGQAILEHLEHSNLFIIPLDNQRRWYRYHHLFADALRYRLGQAHPNIVPTLHCQASAWYEQQGFVGEAISHALAAPDDERAARLIEEHGIAVIGRGQARTVLEWLNALPDELVRARTRLCITHAAALTFTYQLEAAEARLLDAEQSVQAHPPGEQDQAILGQIAVMRAALARIPGDIARCVAFADQALELLPESDTFWRGPAAVYAGLVYRLSGDVTQASEKRAEEAVRLARASGNTIAALVAMNNLARLRMVQGRLRRAAETFQEIWEWATEHDEWWLLVGSPAYYLGTGDLLREWNNLDAAEHNLSQGIEKIKWIIDAEVITWGYRAFADLRQAQGDLHGALETIEAFLQLARQRHFAFRFITVGTTTQVELWIKQGNLKAAAGWARACGLSADDELSYPRREEHLTLARVFMAQSRLEEALKLLGRLMASAEAGEQMWGLIRVSVLQALTLQTQGDLGRAMAALGRALSLAEPEGYVRAFVDEGAPMAALLREAAARGLYPQYAAKLLAAFPDFRSQSATRHLEPIIADSLSKRELAVLQLIAAGRSSPEIADALGIGVSTVRTHIKNIYGKLDAHSRDQVIVRARALRLL